MVTGLCKIIDQVATVTMGAGILPQGLGVGGEEFLLRETAEPSIDALQSRLQKEREQCAEAIGTFLADQRIGM